MTRSGLAALGLLLSGCALLGKSEPLVPRFFTPEQTGEAQAVAARPGLLLRLGRIEGWAHLRERMVVRSPTRELSFLEGRRWLERPEVYLRRALSRALFEERGVVESLQGRGPTLEVELVAFEEVVRPHQARLVLVLRLHDERVAMLQETITVEQEIAGGAGTDAALVTVEALSQALHAGVARAADRVVAALRERSAHATR